MRWSTMRNCGGYTDSAIAVRSAVAAVGAHHEGRGETDAAPTDNVTLLTPATTSTGSLSAKISATLCMTVYDIMHVIFV